MSRPCREDDAQMKKFSSTLPHFFKIILEETLRTNKLQIPNKFVRMYGHTLSDPIRLKFPCGLRWDVGLTKCDGKVWIVHKAAASKVRQVTPRGSISSKAVAGNTMNKKTEMSAPGKCLEPLTANKKARALEVASSFRPENPFFTVSLGATCATGRSPLNIPYKFAKTNINKIEGDAILKVSDGRSWSVLYRVRSRSNHSPAYELCQGWTAFVRDNNLKEGDICTFELTNGNDLSFDVSIVKANVPLPQSK